MPNTAALDTLFARVQAPPNKNTVEPANLSKKARNFAHFISFFWIYYCIGLWYGGRFLPPESQPETTFLFGAVFIVWFAAFFGYIGFRLAKKNRQKRV